MSISYLLQSHTMYSHSSSINLIIYIWSFLSKSIIRYYNFIFKSQIQKIGTLEFRTPMSLLKDWVRQAVGPIASKQGAEPQWGVLLIISCPWLWNIHPRAWPQFPCHVSPFNFLHLDSPALSAWRVDLSFQILKHQNPIVLTIFTKQPSA